MRLLLLAVVVLVVAAPAAAAPDGFVRNEPMTARAVKVGGNPVVTVYCAASQQVWANTEDAYGVQAYGLTHSVTREIWLPVETCGPLRKWLQGKPVQMLNLGDALYVFAHELGHGVGIRDELLADCWGIRHFNAVARAFGVKTPTLKRLRDLTPLSLVNC